MSNNLKVNRKEMQLTQQQVADYVGVSRESYNALENGKVMPSLVVADSLARLFGVNLYELWTLESENCYNSAIEHSYLDGKHSAIDALMQSVDVLDF